MRLNRYRISLPVKAIRSEDTLLYRDNLIAGCIGHGKAETLYLVCDIVLTATR